MVSGDKLGSVILSLIFLFLFWVPGGAEETATLSIVPVRKLLLGEPLFEGGAPFLSAASGLVKFGETFYAVADDAHELISFQGLDPGKHRSILNRPSLPADMEFRKKVKPDFEALTLVRTPQGPALLALGSGSGKHRYAGVLIELSWFGSTGKALEFDLTILYEALEKEISALNIEGVSVVGDRLRLLQRGSGTTHPNAVIDLDLTRFLAAAREGTSDSNSLLEITKVDLGEIQGKTRPVRWTFTDLCPLSQGACLFTATAEDTDNPYHDGEILGSAVGVLERDGSVSTFQKVNLTVKLEGIALDGNVIYLVNDADDPTRPAQLFRLTL